MMKYTSAEANKLLRQLNEQYDTLLSKAEQSASFVAAVGEDIETVRPAYDYASSEAEMTALLARIRTVKHALNVFNSTTAVPEFGMTIDEMLIYIPQLTAKKRRLGAMQNRLPKTRERSYGSSPVIEYNYANYDIERAAADYIAVSELLAKAQTALDVVNNSATLEIGL